MKRLILFLILLLPVSMIAQKRAAKREYEKAIQDGWEIVIDPIERVPEKTISMKRMSALVATNWGRDLLLPNDIRERLINECRYPVVVKVGDTGDPQHDYLKNGHLPAANYTTDQSVVDGHGHSTHVCGIIAANELGLLEALTIRGIVQFKACKVLSNSGSGSFQWVADMFNKEFSQDTALLNRGTWVVYNMSLGGGTSKVTAVETAMQRSTSYGVLIAVANGNTGGPGVQYPGNSIYVIGTASLDQDLQRSSYSTFGPETMVAMPGRSINSTYKGNTFAVLSGTSMATPFTTAIIAIARSKWGPKIKSVEHLRAYLAKCAADLPPTGRDEYTGFGIEYVKAILDTDPSTVGSNPPEPPKPVDPDSLKREVRTLTIPLRGEWKITYNPSIAAVPKKKNPKPVTGSEFRAFVDAQVTSVLTITSIDVAVKTEYYFPFTHKFTKAAVDKFFTNRGLMMSGQTDANDGLNWTAYFLDLIAYTQYGKIDLDILRIEAKDPSGRTIFIDGTKLRKYTPK